MKRAETPNDAYQMILIGILIIAILDALLRFSVNDLRECMLSNDLVVCLAYQANPL